MLMERLLSQPPFMALVLHGEDLRGRNMYTVWEKDLCATKCDWCAALIQRCLSRGGELIPRDHVVAPLRNCELDTRCLACGGELIPEHAHMRCSVCKQRDSCCF